MKHLGDITKINGAEIEPVDTIIFGAPCQDLSVAGKRNGMKHEDKGDTETTRSGLFYEAVRIIKEMRNADKLRHQRLSNTENWGGSESVLESREGGICGDNQLRNTDAISPTNWNGGSTNFESRITQYGLCSSDRRTDDIRPRYAVYENVPGAFSSNQGKDFRAVLEEIARVADETVSIPMPPKSKWTNAGSIMGNGWSIAWRVLDAQYWGVPQRRRRIALVADFGGQSAAEILFERIGLSGNIEEGRETGQGVAEGVEGGFGEAIAYGLDSYNQTMSSEVMNPLRSANGGDTKPMCMVSNVDNQGGIMVCQAEPVALDRAAYNSGRNAQYGMSVDESGVAFSMTAKGPGAVATYQATTGPLMANTHPGSYSGQDAYTDMFASNGYTVRRLTPLEAERLQGFPDGWTNIPEFKPHSALIDFFTQVFGEHSRITASAIKTRKAILKWMKSPVSDSARYKTLGNSIALPPWRWICQRIRSTYDRPITLGSLFDGIGGFPLIWEEINGNGAARWASEIEPFPIAVTKFHFGEEA